MWGTVTARLITVVPSSVSLENVMTDVSELEKGMEAAKREMYVRQNVKDDSMKTALREFLAGADDKLRWAVGWRGGCCVLWFRVCGRKWDVCLEGHH